jgi:molecular chaperone GrpE
MTFEQERSGGPVPPEDDSVTSRDETSEPSGEEEPANEAERDSATPRPGATSEPASAQPRRSEDEAAPPEQDAPAAAGVAPAGAAGSRGSAKGAPQEVAEEDPLVRAERERDEYLDLARRTQADFENYRKRAAKEAAAAGERAKSGLVRELLPVVDNLERALQSADQDEQHLTEGVRLVLSELIAVLERNGIEQFDPRGESFDPTVHEALSTRSEDGAEPGVVLDVVEKGYRANGTVLRPARVIVSG